MKKKVVYVAAALIIAVVAGLNVKTVLESNHDYDLTMASIDALSEDGGQESNNEGSGQFYYKHLLGKPDFCTLYCHVHLSGTVVYSESSSSLGAGWTSSKVEGLRERCPKDGDGCTAYSCQTTNK